MNIVVTGAAGFIGMHTALRLLERGDRVLGVDNLSPYYDVNLKRARLARLVSHPGFSFAQVDLAHPEATSSCIAGFSPTRVVHLAAQAGVRHSLREPLAYADANLVGFVNVLEAARHARAEHLVYASSSSVYGGSPAAMFREDQAVDHPVSLYAATKKANELMAHSYSHLFDLPTTGLRFFTVYGPWGRPDMAYFLFTRAILEGRPIDVYNHGHMRRDFTYIDDIVEGVVRVLDKPATADAGFDAAAPAASRSSAPYRVFNIGNNRPVELLDFIASLEEALGRRAVKNLLPMQPGDVPVTAADTDALEAWIGWRPGTPHAQGLARFVDWYRHYYAVP